MPKLTNTYTHEDISDDNNTLNIHVRKLYHNDGTIDITPIIYIDNNSRLIKIKNMFKLYI